MSYLFDNIPRVGILLAREWTSSPATISSRLCTPGLSKKTRRSSRFSAYKKAIPIPDAPRRRANIMPTARTHIGTEPAAAPAPAGNRLRATSAASLLCRDTLVPMGNDAILDKINAQFGVDRGTTQCIPIPRTAHRERTPDSWVGRLIWLLKAAEIRIGKI